MSWAWDLFVGVACSMGSYLLGRSSKLSNPELEAQNIRLVREASTWKLERETLMRRCNNQAKIIRDHLGDIE